MTLRLALPIVAILAAVALSCAFSAVAHADARVVCHEDQPCWSWPIMGNHQRGVVVRTGRTRVVGPCGFARLARAHRIDWTTTDHLRGDRYARKHGCKS